MHQYEQDTVTELYMLQLLPERMDCFVRYGETVHRYFEELEGYGGLEMLILSGTELLVLIKWQTCRLFDMYLPQILNAVPVKAWLAQGQLLWHRPSLTRQLTPTGAASSHLPTSNAPADTPGG